MGLNLKYLTDAKGNKNAVLLPIRDWERIEKDLEEFGKLKNKKAFFEGLTHAVIEVNEVIKGNKKPNTIEDLLNAL